MKKLLIIIIITIYTLLILAGLIFANLSDETLEIVDDLRWKHSFGTLICDNIAGVLISDGQIEWTQNFLSMWVEDGIFYVETQDGKWFVEMEKIEEK